MGTSLVLRCLQSLFVWYLNQKLGHWIGKMSSGKTAEDNCHYGTEMHSSFQGKMLMSFHRMKGSFESLPSHCKIWGLNILDGSCGRSISLDRIYVIVDSWQAITRDMLRILDQWRSMIKLVGRALFSLYFAIETLGVLEVPQKRDPLFCAMALPLKCQPTK